MNKTRQKHLHNSFLTYFVLQKQFSTKHIPSSPLFNYQPNPSINMPGSPSYQENLHQNHQNYNNNEREIAEKEETRYKKIRFQVYNNENHNEHHHEQQTNIGNATNLISSTTTMSRSVFRLYPCIFMLCKILVVLISIYAILSTATSGYLYAQKHFFKIPALEDLHDGLKDEIANLTGTLDVLQKQSDRLQRENERLEEEKFVLVEQNSIKRDLQSLLYENITLKQQLNLELEYGILNYSESNEELILLTSQKNELTQNLSVDLIRFQQASQDLANVSDALEQEIEILETNVENLEHEVNITTHHVEAIRVHIDILEENQQNLSDTVDELEIAVAQYKNQTDILGQNILKVESLVAYVNNTYVGEEFLYSTLVEFTVQSTDSWRVFTKDRLRMNMIDIRGKWRNDLLHIYSDHAFIINMAARDAIGSESLYNEIFDYSFHRYFQDGLCVDRNDMNTYMLNISAPYWYGVNKAEDMHFYSLHYSAYSYIFEVIDWYFPPSYSAPNSSKIFTEYDWESAKYQCQNVPHEKRFCFWGNCTFGSGNVSSDLPPSTDGLGVQDWWDTL